MGLVQFSMLLVIAKVRLWLQPLCMIEHFIIFFSFFSETLGQNVFFKHFCIKVL